MIATVSTNTALTAIRSMILDAIDTTIFLPQNIIAAFQAPVAGNFITYILLNAKKVSLTGSNSYDDVALTRTNSNANNQLAQIDFWSDDKSNGYANDGANIMYQYLTAIGDFFLNDNYPGITTAIIDEVVNNTQTGDKGTYLSRYTVRFSLFVAQYLTRPETFIDTVNVTPVFFG